MVQRGLSSTRSPMEGRAGSLSQHMHTPACTHISSRAVAQTGPWAPQTFTQTHDAVPLPDSEKEPWIQILASHQHRDTNTCVHTSLWRVMQKMREKRVK